MNTNTETTTAIPFNDLHDEADGRCWRIRKLNKAVKHLLQVPGSLPDNRRMEAMDVIHRCEDLIRKELALVPAPQKDLD